MKDSAAASNTMGVQPRAHYSGRILLPISLAAAAEACAAAAAEETPAAAAAAAPLQCVDNCRSTDSLRGLFPPAGDTTTVAPPAAADTAAEIAAAAAKIAAAAGGASNAARRGKLAGGAVSGGEESDDSRSTSCETSSSSNGQSRSTAFRRQVGRWRPEDYEWAPAKLLLNDSGLHFWENVVSVLDISSVHFLPFQDAAPIESSEPTATPRGSDKEQSEAAAAAAESQQRTSPAAPGGSAVAAAGVESSEVNHFAAENRESDTSSAGADLVPAAATVSHTALLQPDCLVVVHLHACFPTLSQHLPPFYPISSFTFTKTPAENSGYCSAADGSCSSNVPCSSSSGNAEAGEDVNPEASEWAGYNGSNLPLQSSAGVAAVYARAARAAEAAAAAGGHTTLVFRFLGPVEWSSSTQQDKWQQVQHKSNDQLRKGLQLLQQTVQFLSAVRPVFRGLREEATTAERLRSEFHALLLQQQQQSKTQDFCGGLQPGSSRDVGLGLPLALQQLQQQRQVAETFYQSLTVEQAKAVASGFLLRDCAALEEAIAYTPLLVYEHLKDAVLSLVTIPTAPSQHRLWRDVLQTHAAKKKIAAAGGTATAPRSLLSYKAERQQEYSWPQSLVETKALPADSAAQRHATTQRLASGAATPGVGDPSVAAAAVTSLPGTAAVTASASSVTSADSLATAAAASSPESLASPAAAISPTDVTPAATAAAIDGVAQTAAPGAAIAGEEGKDDTALALPFTLLGGGCRIPKGMQSPCEDALFLLEEEGVFGVFDGVGSWAAEGVDASRFSNGLANACIAIAKSHFKPAAVTAAASSRPSSPLLCNGAGTSACFSCSDCSPTASPASRGGGRGAAATHHHDARESTAGAHAEAARMAVTGTAGAEAAAEEQAAAPSFSGIRPSHAAPTAAVASAAAEKPKRCLRFAALDANERARELLRLAHAKVRCEQPDAWGSSTAVVGVFDRCHGKLGVACLGDSVLMVLRRQLLPRSMQHRSSTQSCSQDKETTASGGRPPGGCCVSSSDNLCSRSGSKEGTCSRNSPSTSFENCSSTRCSDASSRRPSPQETTARSSGGQHCSSANAEANSSSSACSRIASCGSSSQRKHTEERRPLRTPGRSAAMQLLSKNGVPRVLRKVRWRSVEQRWSNGAPYQLSNLPAAEEWELLRQQGHGRFVDVLERIDAAGDSADLAAAADQPLVLQPGDLILLFSDGVADNLFDREIEVFASFPISPEDARAAQLPRSAVTHPKDIAAIICKAALRRAADRAFEKPFTPASEESLAASLDFRSAAATDERCRKGAKKDDISCVALWVCATSDSSSACGAQPLPSAAASAAAAAAATAVPFVPSPSASDALPASAGAASAVAAATSATTNTAVAAESGVGQAAAAARPPSQQEAAEVCTATAAEAEGPDARDLTATATRLGAATGSGSSPLPAADNAAATYVAAKKATAEDAAVAAALGTPPGYGQAGCAARAVRTNEAESEKDSSAAAKAAAAAVPAAEASRTAAAFTEAVACTRTAEQRAAAASSLAAATPHAAAAASAASTAAETAAASRADSGEAAPAASPSEIPAPAPLVAVLHTAPARGAATAQGSAAAGGGPVEKEVAAKVVGTSVTPAAAKGAAADVVDPSRLPGRGARPRMDVRPIPAGTALTTAAARGTKAAVKEATGIKETTAVRRTAAATAKTPPGLAEKRATQTYTEAADATRQEVKVGATSQSSTPTTVAHSDVDKVAAKATANLGASEKSGAATNPASAAEAAATPPTAARGSPAERDAACNGLPRTLLPSARWQNTRTPERRGAQPGSGLSAAGRTAATLGASTAAASPAAAFLRGVAAAAAGERESFLPCTPPRRGSGSATRGTLLQSNDTGAASAGTAAAAWRASFIPLQRHRDGGRTFVGDSSLDMVKSPSPVRHTNTPRKPFPYRQQPLQQRPKQNGKNEDTGTCLNGSAAVIRPPLQREHMCLEPSRPMGVCTPAKASTGSAAASEAAAAAAESTPVAHEEIRALAVSAIPRAVTARAPVAVSAAVGEEGSGAAAGAHADMPQRSLNVSRGPSAGEYQVQQQEELPRQQHQCQQQAGNDDQRQEQRTPPHRESESALPPRCVETPQRGAAAKILTAATTRAAAAAPVENGSKSTAEIPAAKISRGGNQTASNETTKDTSGNEESITPETASRQERRTKKPLTGAHEDEGSARKRRKATPSETTLSILTTSGSNAAGLQQNVAAGTASSGTTSIMRSTTSQASCSDRQTFTAASVASRARTSPSRLLAGKDGTHRLASAGPSGLAAPTSVSAGASLPAGAAATADQQTSASAEGAGNTEKKESGPCGVSSPAAHRTQEQQPTAPFRNSSGRSLKHAYRDAGQRGSPLRAARAPRGATPAPATAARMAVAASSTRWGLVLNRLTQNRRRSRTTDGTPTKTSRALPTTESCPMATTAPETGAGGRTATAPPRTTAPPLARAEAAVAAGQGGSRETPAAKRAAVSTKGTPPRSREPVASETAMTPRKEATLTKRNSCSVGGTVAGIVAGARVSTCKVRRGRGAAASDKSATPQTGTQIHPGCERLARTQTHGHHSRTEQQPPRGQQQQQHATERAAAAAAGRGTAAENRSSAGGAGSSAASASNAGGEGGAPAAASTSATPRQQLLGHQRQQQLRGRLLLIRRPVGSVAKKNCLSAVAAPRNANTSKCGWQRKTTRTSASPAATRAAAAAPIPRSEEETTAAAPHQPRSEQSERSNGPPSGPTAASGRHVCNSTLTKTKKGSTFNKTSRGLAAVGAARPKCVVSAGRQSAARQSFVARTV